MRSHAGWSGQLSWVIRWLGTIAGLIWVACFERLLGFPVLTLAVIVIWLLAIRVRGDWWVGAALLILSGVISVLYQSSWVGILLMVLIQLGLFVQLRTVISSFTIRWWLIGWIGAVGLGFLTGEWRQFAVWWYPFIMTSAMVAVLKVVAWWQRVRYRLQSVTVMLPQ